MKREFALVAMLLSPITLALVQAEPAHNPIIWADVPDVAGDSRGGHLLYEQYPPCT